MEAEALWRAWADQHGDARSAPGVCFHAISLGGWGRRGEDDACHRFLPMDDRGPAQGELLG